MLVCEFVTINKAVIMPQPPYLPDLIPADFFLFPKLKVPMKRKYFATIEIGAAGDTKKRVSEAFRGLEKR